MMTKEKSADIYSVIKDNRLNLINWPEIAKKMPVEELTPALLLQIAMNVQLITEMMHSQLEVEA